MWGARARRASGVTCRCSRRAHYRISREGPGPVRRAGDRGPCLVRLLPRSRRLMAACSSRFAAVEVEGVPADFSFGEIHPTGTRMSYVETAMKRGRSEEVGVAVFCGPERFTRCALAAGPEVKNYFARRANRSASSRRGIGASSRWTRRGPDARDLLSVDRLHPYRRRRSTGNPHRRVVGWSTSAITRTSRCRRARAKHRLPRPLAARAYFPTSGLEGAYWYAHRRGTRSGATTWGARAGSRRGREHTARARRDRMDLRYRRSSSCRAPRGRALEYISAHHVAAERAHTYRVPRGRHSRPTSP